MTVQGLQQHPPRYGPVRRQRSNKVAAALVGRSTELSALDVRLDAAQAGESGFVFAVGEPGIGKSRLVDAAAGRARDRGMRVLCGRTGRLGASAMRPFAEALLGLARTGWSPPAALGPYVAVLGQLVPDWQPADTGPTAFPPFIWGEAILRVLAASGSTAVLLILEDLHDADPDTLATLEYLVDNAAAEPLAVVCTARDIPCPALEMAASVRRRDPGAIVSVPRLDHAESAALAADVLGTDPGRLGGEFRDALFRDAAGNPLVIIEVVRDLVANRALVCDAETGLWTSREPRRLQVPLSLARSVAQYLRRADPVTRRVLEAAAVLGEEFPPDVLGAVAGAADTELWPALDLAVRDQVLAPPAENGWFAFRHPLIERAVRDGIAPSTHAALALAAAEQIERRQPGQPVEWRVRAAALRESAGDGPGAERQFAAAGRLAAAAGSPALAVDLLRRALNCRAAGPRDTAWAQLLGSLISALGMTGRTEEAFRHFAEVDDAVRAGLAPETAAELYTGFARVALRTGWSGRVPTAVHAARNVLGAQLTDAAAAELDAIEAYLALEKGVNGSQGPEILARRAIDRARAAGLPAVECDALLTLGASQGERQPEQALGCYQQAYQLAREKELTAFQSEALVLLASHRWLWHADPSAMQASEAQARAQGAVVEMRRAQVSLALDALFRARFDDARARLDTAWEDIARLKLPGLGSYALAVRAMLYAHQGREPELAAAIAEFDRWRGEREDELPLVRGLAQAVAAALRGDTGDAREHLRQLRVSADDPARKYHLCGDAGFGILLQAVAGPDDTADLRALGEQTMSRLPWNRQFVRFAEAVRAGRAGDRAGAETALARARAASAAFPLARHLSLRLVSASAARDGWGDPALWLGEAEAFFLSTGNRTAAKCCRDELRGLGGPVRQWRSGSREIPRALWALGVTVREYEVLRLVMQHKTNREIGSRLHLSSRTVERHVANLLPKFGAADRRELAGTAAEILGWP